MTDHGIYDPDDATREDWRRSAALVLHHSRADADGVNAILREAYEAGRIAPLILGVCDVYSTLLPELRTETAITFLSEWVLNLAGNKMPDPDDPPYIDGRGRW